MTTDEFEKLIEGQMERPALDFKASSPWDVKKLVKDILAMSNLPDGGYIVIGVSEEDKKFKRTGVDNICRKTYSLDLMRDQISRYADPMINFNLYFPVDSAGLFYVVIRILSFREVPTICKKDLDTELRASTIYYRNTSRRVESAAVSNVNDLRDIIELAAVRLMQRRRDFGFMVPDDQIQLYDPEIDAANKLEQVKLIKTKGFCEISVTPLVKSHLNDLSKCLRVVEQSQVQKEWQLPVIPKSNILGRVDTAENCYQGVSNIGSRKEVWRMHLSEHFYMVNAFVEDWLEGDSLRGALSKDFPSGQCFFYSTTLVYYLTELYEFLKRLVLQGLYERGARISIQFKNMGNRQLILDGLRTIPFFNKRTTTANTISMINEYDRQTLVSDSIELSNKVILQVCEYFQYQPGAHAVRDFQTLILNDPFT